MKKIVYLFISVLLFSACDVIEGSPFEEVDNINTGQKVVIEEFTGHKCGNCPEGTEEIKRLQGVYGDKLIAISVHAGFFADTNKSGTKFRDDYKTEVGNEIATVYSTGKYPAAIINRGLGLSETNPKNYEKGKEQWGTEIQKRLTLLPKATLAIENSFEISDRQLNVKVTLNYNKQSLPSENLIVYLTEDSIMSWQKDYRLNPEDIAAYPHMHVLRASLNGVYGEQVSPAPVKVGARVVKTYSYILPQEYNHKHMHIVAMLSDNTTKQILQAEESKLF